jgi:hypothetical protein
VPHDLHPPDLDYFGLRLCRDVHYNPFKGVAIGICEGERSRKMNPVETYLAELRDIRATRAAVAETSYYGPLASLLNEIGATLKPKVRCVINLANRGAGIPDGGLFTANQFQRGSDTEPQKGQLPERGVIEIKPARDDAWVIADGAQVSKYWQHYGQVLVTNYRDFVLVGKDADGRPVKLETFRLAPDETAFWDMAAHPRRASEQQGERLVEYLKRVMLQSTQIATPEDVAWFLASYARDARARLEQAADLPALENLKKGIEEALGMAFEGEKGEHFFRATLIQTLFYGVFSSWVLWCRDHWGHPKARFNWHEAGWTLHVPMIAGLFSQIATPQKLKPLHIDEVLDWAGAVLNRVDRPAFFSKFEEEHAVQYFYEPFLKAYDPELRKELGVWYTPPEIVQYQVERVDRVLREELDIPDGLADDRVVVLDPCCGTGAYLVETLKRIHQTLEERGTGALLAQKLKRAAKDRVFGFEILPAPFVVAHLQLGLMLRRLGAPLDHDTNERVGVYLTNALTGWEPPEDPKNQLPLFPELLEERDAANKVKQQVPIIVILGNPPYNAFAGTSPEEEGGLVDAYKEGLTKPVREGGWGIKKFNLDDLYVRFFRIAERRIVKSGSGVVCYISNFSYLSDPSFVVMRQRFLGEFDKLWFDCMNGDSRETGKLTPEGKPDPSVFSTEQTSVGIRVGTVVGLLVRKKTRAKTPKVRLQDYWGIDKRQNLLDSLGTKGFDRKYKTAKPEKNNRYSFRPSSVGESYLRWPLIPSLALEHHNGPVERRAFALISIEREPLEHRMQQYFDASIADDDIMRICPPLMMTGNRIVGPKARQKIRQECVYSPSSIVRYPFKPFDVRWCYLANIRPLFSEPSPRLLSHGVLPENAYFITRDTADKTPEGVPFLFSKAISDYDSISGHARHFPVLLRHGCEAPREERNGQYVFEDVQPYCVTKANLSDQSRKYLQGLKVGDPDSGWETASLIWMHALAIGYSPAYLNDNADGIRQDWPRIPLPASKKGLLASAELGRRVAALLDTERPVGGVTKGRLDPHLKGPGVISKVGGGALNPQAGELDLTAGWGHGGQGGVCMPGKGRCEIRHQASEALSKAFGDETLDVYLNDFAYWANVPKPVWEYVIGGYQAIKKWLSYREKCMLGRGLNLEEAEYVTDMIRRIAAILLLHPALDANYEAVKADTYSWPM